MALDSTCGNLYHSHHKTATDPTTQETVTIRESLHSGFILYWLVSSQGTHKTVFHSESRLLPEAQATFLGAQDKFDTVNGGGGGRGLVGEIGIDRGEGGVNFGNIGEVSWVRDFP